VLLGANLPHYWRNDARAQAPAGRAHSLVIQFREECFGTEFLSLPELAETRKLLLRARRGLAITGVTRREVTDQMLRLKKEKGLSAVIGLLNILKPENRSWTEFTELTELKERHLRKIRHSPNWCVSFSS